MYLIPIRLANTVKSDDSRFEQRYRIVRTLKHHWRGSSILLQENSKSPNVSAGLYPKETPPYGNEETCTKVSTGAVFVIAKEKGKEEKQAVCLQEN